MADNAASQEDDLSLPRAAVNKMIKEMIPNIRISNDARELVLNCCTEFIHLIASESNEICNKQTKKTISPDHVIAALDSLGFHDYVKDVEGVYKQFKTQTQTRKMNNKMKNQGVSEEELLRQQQELFAKAREQQAQEDWLHMQQQQQQQQRLSGDTSAPLSGPPHSSEIAASQYPPIPTRNTAMLPGQQTTQTFTNFQPPTVTGGPPPMTSGNQLPSSALTNAQTIDYDSSNSNNSSRGT